MVITMRRRRCSTGEQRAEIGHRLGRELFGDVHEVFDHRAPCCRACSPVSRRRYHGPEGPSAQAGSALVESPPSVAALSLPLSLAPPDASASCVLVDASQIPRPQVDRLGPDPSSKFRDRRASEGRRRGRSTDFRGSGQHVAYGRSTSRMKRRLARPRWSTNACGAFVATDRATRSDGSLSRSMTR